MPIDGHRLVNPYGPELMFERTADGVVAWAEALAELVDDAVCRGDPPAALWSANRALGEELLHRYRHHCRVHGAITAARDYAQAKDIALYLAST